MTRRTVINCPGCGQFKGAGHRCALPSMRPAPGYRPVGASLRGNPHGGHLEVAAMYEAFLARPLSGVDWEGEQSADLASSRAALQAEADRLSQPLPEPTHWAADYVLREIADIARNLNIFGRPKGPPLVEVRVTSDDLLGDQRMSRVRTRTLRAALNHLVALGYLTAAPVWSETREAVVTEYTWVDRGARLVEVRAALAVGDLDASEVAALPR